MTKSCAYNCNVTKSMHTKREKGCLLNQEGYIIRCISPRSSWLPQRPSPVFIGSRHVGWHRVKSVASERIRHIAPLPIWHGDFYLVKANDLRRRNTVFRPIPVCKPQFEGGIYPLIFVRSSVRCSNFSCMVINDLLEEKKESPPRRALQGWTHLDEHCVRPVPSWEQSRTMSAVSSCLVYGVCLKSINTISAVIRYERVAMDASDLKPGKQVVLVSILHCGYIR